MRRSLYVHLNRDGMKTLRTDTDAFTTDGSFKIILENHGQPAHVHLHLDDGLADIATLEEANWYVPAGDIEPVEVQVPDGATGAGQLEISTGYGAERAQVDIRVDSNGESADQATTVEETQSEPISTDDATGPDLSRVVLPGLFAAGGVLIAVALMVLVSPTAAVMLGALALLVAIAAAGYLMIQT